RGNMRREREHRWRRRAQADAQGIPVVFASRASYLDDADTVRPDNMQAAQLLTEYLIRQGHQRIAWLGGQSASLTRAERLAHPPITRCGAERVGGYCATLLKYGLPFHSEWVVECASSQKQAAESITALLRYNPTISAVVCYNETIAMGAWFGLLRAGRQSGESGVDRYFEQQVSLAAFADVAENALDDLPIICASTPAREIGYTLAERILQRIAHDEHHVRSQTIAARLVTQK
ncbi:Maltose regulon regulatory protein malI, partial [Salmonella enterica subsp. enterica serovar Baildon str. R6-199]